MSRSQPALTNPATRFFDWKGGTGVLSFYDKEQQKSIPVPLPFEFLVLDELSTITGYNKAEESGYWSNEVRSTIKEDLTVRTKKGVQYIGKYKNDQGIVQMPKGASYTKSIYIAYKTKNGYEIGNIKASGSALSAWIEFGNEHIVANGKVVMTKGAKQTSPVGDFYAPVFEYVHATPEEDAVAIDLDKELQIYLSQYLAAKPEDAPVEEAINPDDIGKATPEQIAEFENLKAKKLKPADEDADSQSLYNSIAEAESTEEPIDPSEIPF